MLIEQRDVAVAVVVREHLVRLLEDLDLSTLVPPAAVDAALTDLELGLGQLLGDVERAQRRGVSLGYAVHAHEDYPYLGRFHGTLHDTFVLELPPELAPIMKRVVRRPPPGWAHELLDQLCIVARAAEARPEERAFARLVIFEALRVGLGFVAYQTDGVFEGIGGSRRDMDTIAAVELERLLQTPLALDATTPYRPLVVTMAAAMVRLTEHLEGLRAVRSVTQELCNAIRDRAELEMLLRHSDPVDATILRHQYDRADHLQPIPVSRLPLEHPLVLAGHTDTSIYKRRSRALEKLEQSPDTLERATKPLTLPELLLHLEDSDA
jgi:hypothetical protein